APATRRYALAVFCTVFGVVVGTYVLMAAVRGELVPGPGHVSLWDGIQFQLWQRASGGGITDPGSLKRHTIDEWLQLDPALPLLAAPVAAAGLLVPRLRPFAAGLAIFVVTVLRPGYLPVPLVVAALPLVALLSAGTAEAALRHLSRQPKQLSAFWQRFRTPVLTAGAVAVSVVISLWLPGLREVAKVDTDASTRQAQQWISQNVPKNDRLIVDDALWVDLVRENRDRRNVVWAYKVDTDEQVRKWAPHGWSDYEWVVSTASLRANMPKNGVITDAISHAQPAASFGTGGKRVDVMRIEKGTSTSKPAAPAFGVQVSTRLAASTDPDMLAVLQSGMVDQRVLAALAVLSATQPVALEDISAVGGEDAAESPRREFTLTGSREDLQAKADFFKRQVAPFAVESVEMTPNGLTVRFPVATKDYGLGAGPAPVPDGSAGLRVADMRRAPPADRLEFVRIDGTAAGTLDLSGTANPSDYRSMPAGAYVMMTTIDGRAPIIRQVFTIAPGASYTLVLFSARESSEVAAQLAPDGPPGGPSPEPSVRLVHAAGAAGYVKLALASAGGEQTVLADGADYGLVTGYAPMPVGQYDAVVTANGRESHQPIALTGIEPRSLVLTDGPDGPVLGQLPDVPEVRAGLDPPTLTIPAAGATSEKTQAKQAVATNPRQKVIPLVLCLFAFAVAVRLGVKARARQRR
ncbi:MAG TPA: glycosyl transferase, partial [Mycobacterium sp.]|nr:glycosyl transferase [Mycobacterium sp.]